MAHYNRPYWRKSTIEELERRTPQNEKGEFLDPDQVPIPYDQRQVGHKYGYENRKIDERAHKLNWSQGQFNDYSNNPDILQFEIDYKNQGGKSEAPDNIDYTVDMEQEM